MSRSLSTSPDLHKLRDCTPLIIKKTVNITDCNIWSRCKILFIRPRSRAFKLATPKPGKSVRVKLVTSKYLILMLSPPHIQYKSALLHFTFNFTLITTARGRLFGGSALYRLKLCFIVSFSSPFYTPNRESLLFFYTYSCWKWYCFRAKPSKIPTKSTPESNPPPSEI